MKRFIAFVLVLTLLLSMSAGVAYADPKGKAVGREKEKPAKVEKATGQDKKVFKQELNDQKREVQKEISELERMLEELMAGAVTTEGDVEAAPEGEEIVDPDDETEGEPVEGAGEEASETDVSMTVEEIESRLAELKLQKKEIINQRFMVTKSEYSTEELGNFDSAADLIAQMYEDVNVLGLGSVTVRDNIIKFDTPPYIKGGRTVVPVRAITEELGADLLWDEGTQTVTITMEGSSTTTGTAIVLGINSRVVTVDGEAQTLDTAAEITNGRTYVPLRFIAETFGLDVDWDEGTETIDIEKTEEDELEEAEPEEADDGEEQEADEGDMTGEEQEAGGDASVETAEE